MNDALPILDETPLSAWAKVFPVDQPGVFAGVPNRSRLIWL
jgi:hypothetical protein